MMTDRARKHLPPYVSYRTFYNFVDRLQQQGTPQRIDRSYWSGILSGSTGPQLMAAMRFLGLVDANGKPTERLNLLVPAEGERRMQIVRSIASEAYSFVLESSLNLGSATYAQLEECFHSAFSLTDDVRRKCVKFFIAMASDAGLNVSPHITRHTRATHGSVGHRNGTGQFMPKVSQGLKVPQDKTLARPTKLPQGMELLPDAISLLDKLIDKFPDFDPSWNDEIKIKWITSFDELFRKVIFKG